MKKSEKSKKLIFKIVSDKAFRRKNDDKKGASSVSLVLDRAFKSS